MATTNAFCLASPPLARICLHGDLQRFGRRLSLYVNTAAEAIRALSMQMPVPYGEMLVGSRRISQDISTRDEGGGGKVVVIGRQG
uniref:Tail assembly protein n=1 Tax=Escherichia coli TaxID=562 RepID=A0A6M9X6L2_ECOLX|nr:tail assembly protein [Escherichia coli]